jgi:hypothetical protein
MVHHSSISPQETADRLAIRELIDAYAHCADRRDWPTTSRPATAGGARS